MSIYNNKSVEPAFSVPRSEAFALPNILKRQREAHAEYKINSRAMLTIKVRVCAYVYTQ